MIPGEVSVPGIIETAFLSSAKLKLLTIPSLGLSNIFFYSSDCECQTLHLKCWEDHSGKEK